MWCLWQGEFGEVCVAGWVVEGVYYSFKGSMGDIMVTLVVRKMKKTGDREFITTARSIASA